MSSTKQRSHTPGARVTRAFLILAIVLFAPAIQAGAASPKHMEAAGILARAHKLRGFDAVHLAAARDLGAPGSTRFVVYDEALAKAARKEGFQVLTNPRFKVK